jgi:hexosaminidase
MHGIQSLLQLLLADAAHLPLPEGTIVDAPRFGWRGCLLDCARHFMPVPIIKRFLELMCFHKLNVFHWHLVDDQGWRLPVDDFPRLIEVGAWRRSSSGEAYGGYYSHDEIREIAEFATQLHIMIVPEIELPGHSMSALASYPHLGCRSDYAYQVPNSWGIFQDVYCAGRETTFQFLQAVLDQVCALLPGSPFIHIGGDEVPKLRWQQCPDCQRRKQTEHLQTDEELQLWFVRRIATYLASKGRRIVGWDEILEGKVCEFRSF